MSLFNTLLPQTFLAYESGRISFVINWPTLGNAKNGYDTGSYSCYCAHSWKMVRSFNDYNVKKIDGVPIQERHKATCHCGSVEIELYLPNGVEDLRRCDCSLCRRRGAIAASVPLSGIKIIKGEDKLKLYQFNTNEAKHYFCGECGIYTHHQRRSNPSQYGFNVACLEGVNPLKVQGIPTYDGVNHPEDRKK